jgi:hypothetical protein
MPRRMKLILLAWMVLAAILGVAMGLAWGSGRMPLIMFMILLAFWGVGIPMRYLVWRKFARRSDR